MLVGVKVREEVVLGDARSESEDVGVREDVEVPVGDAIAERVDEIDAVEVTLANCVEVWDEEAPFETEAVMLVLGEIAEATMSSKLYTKIEMVAAICGCPQQPLVPVPEYGHDAMPSPVQESGEPQSFCSLFTMPIRRGPLRGLLIPW